MKWFFLATFVVGVVLCGFVASMIGLALVTREPGEWWKVVIIQSPFLVLFLWATREMFRAFRRAGHTKIQGESKLP